MVGLALRNQRSRLRLLSGLAHNCNCRKFKGESIDKPKIGSQPKDALGFFHIDSATCASLLQEYADKKAIAKGIRVHSRMVVCGIQQNAFLGTKLVTMYVKCGSLIDARLSFDKMPERNLFSWTAIFGGYVSYGKYKEALNLHDHMHRTAVKPNNFIIPCVLKACSGLSALQQGKKMHGYVIRSGFDPDVFVKNSLIDMYAKCGDIEDALQVFDEMCQRDVVSWNAMIGGYAQNGYGHMALELFRQMQLEGVKPNSTTMSSVLPACPDAHKVKDIHGYILRMGFDLQAFLGNALTDIYAKCGILEYACKVFDRMSERDVVSWNVMITGYSHSGKCDEALNLFHQMQVEGVQPNLITWNAMILGYAQDGIADEALNFFLEMQLAGTKPDSAAIVSVLQSCSCVEAAKLGKQIHNYVIKNGFESDAFVISSLIDMYSKSQSIGDARQAFEKMSQGDVVLWTSMIVGYAHNGHFDEALKLFHEMQFSGITPNSVTITSVLSASAHLAVLQQGKEIHCLTIKNGFESDIGVGSALVDMYAKCGSLEDALRMFQTMSQRNLFSLNAMISAYAMHGQGKDALSLFSQMEQDGLKPDHFTFVGVLSACSRAGLVYEGWHYFNAMHQDYDIKPHVEHYACMVDLLGRAGYLYQAHNLINQMPMEPKASVWGALLNACRMHCNLDVAEHAARRLFELEPENAANYVLLSNIFAAAGRWDDVAKVRKNLKYKVLERSPGCSWIEINNGVHVFLVGDKSLPQMEKSYAKLHNLSMCGT